MQLARRRWRLRIRMRVVAAPFGTLARCCCCCSTHMRRPFQIGVPSRVHNRCGSPGLEVVAALSWLCCVFTSHPPALSIKHWKWPGRQLSALLLRRELLLLALSLLLCVCAAVALVVACTELQVPPSCCCSCGTRHLCVPVVAANYGLCCALSCRRHPPAVVLVWGVAQGHPCVPKVLLM